MALYDPPSLAMLYMRGRLMARLNNWSVVQDLFQKILERIETQPYQSISYQVECKYWIAQALKNQNKKDEAYRLVIHALAQSKNWIKDKELENPLESFDTIKELLEKLRNELGKDMME